ncbi:MAG: anhydro-N-acetylmuramic acid kinase [Pseudomonadota bacterium]
MSKLYTALGLMSGTSLDGIDIALITTDGEETVRRGPSQTYPYIPEQRAMLKEALTDALALTDRRERPKSLGQAEWSLTEWHALAVESFCQDFGLNLNDIDVIGFHGQTVLHRPERRLTVQLGDGPLLARRLNRRVVYDMRADDIAVGGQGAPLVPVYHRALAASLEVLPLAFLNIGGVSNVTWIGADGELIAFDTGPGNALIDDWALKTTGRPVDVNGRLAFSGQVNQAALAQFLGDSFFEERPPKSLDRDSFASLDLSGLSPGDGAATLTAFTAGSVALARSWFPADPKLWVICGGGRKNPALMAALRAALKLGPEAIIPAEAAGFNGDSMEAEAWAYLAVRSLRELPITFPGTTGAPEPMTGGIVTEL